MIPYPYNMVDMGGIDLAEANGTVVDGLYAKIVEAVNACGDVILYNWKFADIEIAPQHTSILLGNPITINGAVQVTEQDEVTVPGINPEPPPPPIILPLNVDENGEYLASDFDADGFDPVNVLIPPPVITPLEATENGTYNPPSGVFGYAPVIVSVSSGADNPFALKNYIESSGTQYINTGYIPKQNSEYEFVATFLSGNPSFSIILGARDTREGTAGNPVIFGPGSSSFQLGWGTVTLRTGISSTPFIGLKAVYSFNKDGYDASTESKRPSGYGIFSGGAPLTTNPLYLFSLNAAGSEYGANTRCNAKLYRFRIFESGELVHEFIPWQENSVACMKDTITSEIKYNAGTGNFAYGIDP